MRRMNKPIVILCIGVLFLFVGLLPVVADETSYFETGLNFWASPVQPAADYSSFDLLMDLGDIGSVSGLQRYNTETGEFESSFLHNGFAAGVDFPITETDGFVVSADGASFGFLFSGISSCPDISLYKGFNLVGLPCAPVGYTSYSLLNDIGFNSVIRIKSFDTLANQILETTWSGTTPVGDDFSILNGSAYVLEMSRDSVWSAPATNQPPQFLTAYGGNSYVLLNWEIPYGPPDGYKIYRSESSGGGYSLVSGSSPVVGPEWTDSGVVNGTSYYYVATAVYPGTFESGQSEEVDATPTPASPTTVSTNIAIDTAWSASGSPYTVTGSIQVQSGVTLTIEPGTEIRFDSGHLEILGKLYARGTAAHPITFRSNAASPVLGAWTGIRFIGSEADDSLLEYCIIEHATTGVYCQDSSPEISHCDIVGQQVNAYAYYYGIRLLRSNAHIHHCDISDFVNDSNYLSRAVYMRESSPVVEYNDILNSEYGIEIYYGGTPQIIHNKIENFRYSGILCNGEYRSVNAPFPIINNNIIQTIHSSSDTWNLNVRRYASSSSTTDPSLVIDARNNYWGTDDPAEITAAIHQWPRYTLADPSVDFRGFLDAPNGNAVPGHFIPSGKLPSDELDWVPSNGPYIVLGHTFVASDQTLTINPGTEVRFLGGQAGPENRWIRASLRVYGKLDAQGETGNEILFTSHKTTPVQGDWEAIYFYTGADDSSIISYSRIEYAFNGIYCLGGSPTVDHNEIIGIPGDYYHDKFNGLRIESGSSPLVSNNTISGFHNTYGTTNYYGRGILIYNASPTLTDNQITENSIGIWIDTYGTPVTPHAVHITGNSIINSRYLSVYINGDNSDVRNPLVTITGNSIISDYISASSFYSTYFGSTSANIINATGNWWGTADPEGIGSIIRDWSDDIYAPVVDYRNWLESDGGSPVTGTQVRSGQLRGADLNWTAANSPYMILGRVKVAEGDTLTIEAGTEVYFVNGATGWNDRGIEVRGTLTAIGTFAAPITFRSNRQDPTLGDWTGIRFIGGGADGSLLEYCQIEHAATGIYIEDSSPEISHCTIIGEEKTASAYYFGMYLLRSGAHIHHCNIRNFVNNSNYWTRAIYMRESSPVVEYNDIVNNEYGIEIYYGGTPQILHNRIEDFRYSGILCNGEYRSTNAPFPIINNNIIQTIYSSSDTWNLNVRRYASSSSTTDPSLVINARNNYWGTDDPAEITAAIHQWPRYTLADPFVDFRGFLDGPGGSAVPGHFIPSGKLPSDELNWTASNGPYIVLGHTFVASDQVLTINPGTEVRFLGGQAGPQGRWIRASLRVYGKLDAQGTSGDEILFTSHKNTPGQGDWDAIYFYAGADDSSIISHSRIEYAYHGIYCVGGSLTIDHNEIIGIPGDHYHDMYSGIRIESGSTTLVSNNIITGFHNTYATASYFGRGVLIYNASPILTDNQINENSIGIWVDTSGTPVTPHGVVATGNSIINSRYRSVYIHGDNSDSRNPIVTITGNSIFSDYISASSFYTTYFGSTSANIINATGNWWGTADPEVIGTMIRDWSEDIYAPVVDYRNWLESVGGPSVTGTQIHTGQLRGDNLTWTAANSPYMILGRVKVAESDTLTIQAGTEVYFVNGSTGWNDRGIEVRGTLTAIGTFSDPVIFRSNRPDPTLGDWTGIRFIGSGADGSLLEYCQIEHAAIGIYIEDASPEISHCTIMGEEKTASADYFGIYLLRSNAHIHHCNISHFVNNSNYWARAIYMRESSPLVEYNDILDNEYGIEIYYGGTPQIFHNRIEDFRYSGIYCNGEYRSTNAPFPLINNNTIHTIYTSADTWNLNVRRYASSTSTIDSSLIIDARNNYWGTDNPEEIAASIHQWPRYTLADPFVDFRGFLDAPGGSIVPGHFIPAGRLPADELNWTSTNAPYIVLGHIFVGSDQTLTINPGTEVRFLGGQAGEQDRWIRTSLRVYGKLDAQGLSGNQVVFTSHKNTPVQGDWDTIYFYPGADDSSIIAHSRVEYAFNGIWCLDSSPTISNNEIIGVPGNYYHDYFDGLRFEAGSEAIVSNNVITGFYNNYSTTSYFGRAIHIYNASPILTDNVLDENSIGVWIDTYNPPVTPVAPQITGNSIINSHYRSVYISGDYSDARNPYPVITGNNIFSEYIADSSFYTVYFGSSSTNSIDATGNWWGTTEATEIDGIVRDRADNGDAALVDYSGALGADTGIYTIYSVTVDDDYFSPNGDSQQDSVVISGKADSPTTWTVAIRDAAGTVVRTYNGSLPWVWNGRDNSNTICADGIYTILVQGTDGVTVSSRTLTTRIDTNGVNATIDSPAHGSTQRGIFEVLCSISDDNLFSYTLELGAGATPASWTRLNGDNDSIYNSHDGALPISSHSLYTWVSNDTNSDDIPYRNGFTFNNGDYTLRLTAVDRGGNSIVKFSTITLDNIFITEVSRDNGQINPTLSETADVHFTISHSSAVTIKIYPEWLGEAGGLIRQITRNVTAGAHTISWDGKDGGGQAVEDEAYIYVIEASSGGRSDKYLPTDGHSDGSGVGTIPTDYNVYTNDFWKIDYNVNGPSGRVSMEVTPSGEATFRVVDMEPHEAGETFTIAWDGRRQNGTLIEKSVGVYFPPPTTLRSNYVIVKSTPVEPMLKGIAPHVEVKADPYLINFCYGEFSRILYNLDRTADVTVTILPPGETDPASSEAIVVIDGEQQTMGDHTVLWDGIDALDPKNIIISEEGVYTFVIEATASGYTSNWRGVLNLYR